MSLNTDIPGMTTLVECIQTLKERGYTYEFDVKEGMLVEPYINAAFTADAIAVDNFYRFEGASNPSDSAILYAISTNTGLKGTLVDAYGTYSDEQTDIFFKHVAKISKKTAQ
ncbi:MULTISPECIES: phosphoribosylpyrophosphate synthetase [Chitinophagaceae]